MRRHLLLIMQIFLVVLFRLCAVGGVRGSWSINRHAARRNAIVPVSVVSQCKLVYTAENCRNGYLIRPMLFAVWEGLYVTFHVNVHAELVCLFSAARQEPMIVVKRP